MSEVRFIHSMSTRPLRIGMYGTDALQRMLGNVWYYSLSVAYIKRWGGNIVLHTDSLGKALLGHLPYDEIHLTLDDMPREVSPRFWAAGKMWALGAEPCGAVHIDGDVFIKRRDLAERIAAMDCDIVTQYSEKGTKWYLEANPTLMTCADELQKDGIEITEGDAYNTGLLCIRNKKIRDEFCEGYKHLVRKYSQLLGAKLDSASNECPDLVFEQKRIWIVAEKYGLKVGTLLNDYHTDNTELANAIGYQHILTSGKYAQLDKCQRALAKVSPEIYSKTERLCIS